MRGIIGQTNLHVLQVLLYDGITRILGHNFVRYPKNYWSCRLQVESDNARDNVCTMDTACLTIGFEPPPKSYM